MTCLIVDGAAPPALRSLLRGESSRTPK